MSNCIRADVVEIFGWIKEYIVSVWDNSLLLAEKAAGVSDLIPNDVIAVILYWLIFIMVGIFLMLLLYGVVSYILIGTCYLYLKSDKFDKINRWLMVSSGICFIAMGSEIFNHQVCNLILLWLIIQVIVPLLRYYMIPFITNRIKKYRYMDDEDRRHFEAVIVVFVAIISIVIFLKFVLLKLLFS